jgi:hypothetical protein
MYVLGTNLGLITVRIGPSLKLQKVGCACQDHEVLAVLQISKHTLLLSTFLSSHGHLIYDLKRDQFTRTILPMKFLTDPYSMRSLSSKPASPSLVFLRDRQDLSVLDPETGEQWALRPTTLKAGGMMN